MHFWISLTFQLFFGYDFADFQLFLLQNAENDPTERSYLCNGLRFSYSAKTVWFQIFRRWKYILTKKIENFWVVYALTSVKCFVLWNKYDVDQAVHLLDSLYLLHPVFHYYYTNTVKYGCHPKILSARTQSILTIYSEPSTLPYHFRPGACVTISRILWNWFGN